MLNLNIQPFMDQIDEDMQDSSAFNQLVAEEDFSSLNDRLRIKPGLKIVINGNEEDAYQEYERQDDPSFNIEAKETSTGQNDTTFNQLESAIYP